MNTWHIASRDATTPVNATNAFISDLNTFYQAVDAQFSSLLSGGIPLVQAYNLIENKPRQPIVETTLTALTTAATTAAREICCCLSYRGVYESGVTPKRRRGRIYLGPLQDSAVDSSSGLLSAATVTAIKNAGDVLQAASGASALYGWVVYSPTTDVAGTGETGMYECISGWVDNAPDIQRRRGQSIGVKQTF